MRGKWVFHKRVPPWWRAWVLLGLVLACVWNITLLQGAQAQETDGFSEVTSLPDVDPFSALLSRRGPSAVRLSSREPQLYETAEGGLFFTFQTAGQNAYVRYHCPLGDGSLECLLLAGRPHEEIHLLQASRSPRGDIIYKDSDGEAVLRVTATGGATLYRSDQQFTGQPVLASLNTVIGGGEAVLPAVGETVALAPPSANVLMVEERLLQASDLMSERHGFFIAFTSADSPRNDQTILADTILTAVKAIDLVAADDLGNRIIRERLKVVAFEPRQTAGFDFSDARLTVYYDGTSGIAGRPSSAAIMRYLESVL